MWKDYDLNKSLKKSLEFLLYSGLPALIGYLLNSYPALFSISLGSLLKLLSDYLKHQHDYDVMDKLFEQLKKVKTKLWQKQQA